MRPRPIDFEERDWVPIVDSLVSHVSGHNAPKGFVRSTLLLWPNDWENPMETPRLRFAVCVETVVFKFGLRDSFLNSHLGRF
jgi:hypothetical protein